MFLFALEGLRHLPLKIYHQGVARILLILELFEIEAQAVVFGRAPLLRLIGLEQRLVEVGQLALELKPTMRRLFIL